jgi:signal transduction histidine kinase
MIAHELKGPVTSIKGLAATGLRLHDSLTDDERRDFFRMIDEEAARLSHIAEEASTALKIDAEVLTYDVRLEDLSGLVEEVAWRSSVDEHPLTVHTTPGLTCPCDRQRIAEAIQHGLSNAARFSPPEAPIEVRLSAEDGRAVIEIEDLGPGLTPEERERAFDRFAQLRPAGYEEVSGAGLGLYIARAHVLAHGGRIALLEGREGGTILRIELPTEA